MGGNIPGGSLMGGNFPGGNFPKTTMYYVTSGSPVYSSNFCS